MRTFPNAGAPHSAPWAASPAEIAAVVEVDPSHGLTASEVTRRLERYGPNVLDAEEAVPLWRKLLAQMQDPLVYLLLVAVAVSLGVWLVEGADGVPVDAVVILLIVIANAVLGYVQQARAEEAVAALQRMAAPEASVRRDGQIRSIATTELVPGDVLILAEGDAVAADARLIEVASLSVAEASLTGESEAVPKALDAVSSEAEVGDRHSMVFSGTAVNRGRGVAIVTATGMDTELGHVARLLGRTEAEPTPLQHEIARVSRMLGLAVIATAVIVLSAIFLTSTIETGSDLVDVLLIGVSLAVAAVPEGLPAVLSVVLALGVQRMARRRAIVKRLSSVETLGSASVICSDKTGTLTRNEMTIERIVTPSAELEVTGIGYVPDGDILFDGVPLESDTPEGAAVLEEVQAVLAGGSLANDATLIDNADGTWRIQGDPTEAAFLVAERKLAGLSRVRQERFERIGEIPFSSERKLMTTIEVDAEADGTVAAVTKGAPDVLLARCRSVRVNGEVVPLDDAYRREVLDTVDRLADQALRTLAVAYRPLSDDVAAVSAEGDSTANGPDADDALAADLEQDLVYLGLVGILDPPREEAKIAIDQAHRAGIRVVMITGDHPRTAVRIADSLGITTPPDGQGSSHDGRSRGREGAPSIGAAVGGGGSGAGGGAMVLTGAELSSMDDEQLRARVGSVSVFARVTPEHKLRIVDALQHGGRVVAMTGDGVNDAPALKAADIGVAMGITGTDVSKGAADMILADDNFATIVAAVAEGRGIFDNIQRFLRFLLSSNIGEVLTMFFGVVLASVIGLDAASGAVVVPLLATQILWINLLTDTGPALALGLDPAPEDVMERPPRGLHDRVIDAQMWIGIMIIGLATAMVTLLALDIRLPGGLIDGDGELLEARSMAFTTLVLCQLFNAFNARSERVSAFHRPFTNGWLWAAVGLSLVLQIVVVEVPILNDAFGTYPLPLDDWLICIALASGVLWVSEIRKFILRRVGA